MNKKKNARVAVKYAVDTGKLNRLPCEVCGDPTSEGHHDDYSRPLEVRWLCKTHHTKLHFPDGRVVYKTVKIPFDLYCALKVESKLSGRSLSWLIGQAIREYAASQTKEAA